jgi:site-specific DNA-methyltransferase (adenine-specific)/modification methylase
MMRVEHIGEATLYLADCREVLPTLQGVDAVVTDPPYGANFKTIGRHLNDRRVKNHGKFPVGTRIVGDREQFAPEHLLAMDCHKIIWGAHYFNSRLPDGPGWLVWDKRVNPEHYGTTDQGDCEMAWTSFLGAARMHKQIWNGIVRQGEENVAWGAKQHPLQKPVALMLWCLGLLPSECRTVCDPYMGSGTTGVACSRRGLPFIGIECAAEHFDTACRRIAEAQRQPDLFVPRAMATERVVDDAPLLAWLEAAE